MEAGPATTTIEEEEVNQKLQEHKIMDDENDNKPKELVTAPENPGGNGDEIIQNDSNSNSFHPLCNDIVASKIMSYLNLCDLKEARRVCSTWNQAASPYFYKKAVVCCPKDIPTKAFLDICKKSRFENYTFHNLPRGDIFSDFAKLSGQNIKMLNLVYSETTAKRFKIGSLKVFLQGCPNLEELRCYCASDAFMSGNDRLWTSKENKYNKLKKVTFGGMKCISLRILQDLFNSCPELKSFNIGKLEFFNNSSDEYATAILNLARTGKIDLSKLEELNIYGETRIISSTQAMLQFPQINFSSLVSLQICLDYSTDPSAIQRMFEHLSGTLKELKVANSPPTTDFHNPLIIPVCMTKLEKLEIITENNGFLMGPIASAVKLPNLRVFNMHRYPKHELRIALFDPLGIVLFDPLEQGAIFDFNDCWSRLDANWHTNRCNSLEFIRLPCGLSNPDIFTQIVTVFPNLKNMKIENPSPEVMTAIFTHCTNLERLSIRLVIYPKNIDSILTGLRPSWCKNMVKKNKFIFADPTQITYISSGLRNMTNLKYFELRQYKPSYHLSEVSLYHGFIHLTQAVQLDLQSCLSFSEKSTRDLKKILGPTCFVNIQDDTTLDMEKIRGNNSDFWVDTKRFF